MLWSKFLNGAWSPSTRAGWIRGEVSFPLETQRSDVRLGDSTATGGGTVYPRALTSVQGNALRMDGPQDVMKMDGTVTNGILYPFTVTTWAYISVDTNSYQTVFAIEDGAGHSVHYNELITQVNGTTLTVFDDVTGDLGPVQALSTGTWYALAFKITSGAWSAYVGTEGFSSLTKVSGTLANILFNDLTGIGSTTFTATESFNGRFGMYRVWNAALTDAEIAAELRSSERIVSTGLLSSVFPQGVSAGNELTAQHGTNVLSRGVGTPDWTFEAGPKLLVQTVGVSTLGNTTSAMAGVFGSGGVDGTSVVALANSTATGVGQLTPQGTSAVTLANSTATGVGQLVPQGTSAVTLSATTSTGAGTYSRTGSSAVALANSTSTGVGQLTPQGASAITLAVSTSTGSGTHSIAGTSAVTLAAAAATGVGQLTPQGASAVTLTSSTATGSGTFIDGVSGTAAVTLSDSTATGSGTHSIAGASAVTLAASASTGVGQLTPQGTSAITLAETTSAMVGVFGSGVDGTSAVTLADSTATAVGLVSPRGASAVTLAGVSSSMAGFSGATATSSVQLSSSLSSGVGGHGAFEIFNYVAPGHCVEVSVDQTVNRAIIDLVLATESASGLVKATPDGHSLATASVDQRTYS